MKLLLILLSLALFASLTAGCSSQKDKDAALYQAAMTDDLPGVKKALADGAAVDGVNEDGWTPLMEASGKGNLAVVKYLLEKRAKVNFVATRNRFTPLHAAAQAHHPEVVKILLSRGASTSAQDSKGRTPLDFARAVHRLPSGQKSPEVIAVLTLLEKK